MFLDTHNIWALLSIDWVDCQSALSTVTSARFRSTFCSMVLQERTWIHKVSLTLVAFYFILNVQSSHRKKREAKIKRDVKRGIREANDQDPFEIFVTVTDIRYTCVNVHYKYHYTKETYISMPLRYYKESHKILGQTFGMCVLQDFEAITPNLLARTIETVEGGGLVVIMLKTMKSLRQLYAMTMVREQSIYCPFERRLS